MYTVYVDGKILDYPGDEINCIQDSELKLLLNDAGSFEFDITDKNPDPPTTLPVPVPFHGPVPVGSPM